MARTRKKRDLRVALLRRKYLKLKSEAEKKEKEKAESALKASKSKNKFKPYRYAMKFVRKLKRFCYGLRHFVGLSKKPKSLLELEEDDD